MVVHPKINIYKLLQASSYVYIAFYYTFHVACDNIAVHDISSQNQKTKFEIPETFFGIDICKIE